MIGDSERPIPISFCLCVSEFFFFFVEYPMISFMVEFRIHSGVGVELVLGEVEGGDHCTIVVPQSGCGRRTDDVPITQ